MKEILPGVFHWSREHPKIHFEVRSYFLPEEGVLIDPLVPTEGLDAFDTPPISILLTNRHHYRDSDKFAERFGCTVLCVEQGLHEFKQGEKVTAKVHVEVGNQFSEGEPFRLTVMKPDMFCAPSDKQVVTGN